MVRGYRWYTFGFIQAEREAARVGRFNERWQRLLQIEDFVQTDFVSPLDDVMDRMTVNEYSKLCDYVVEMTNWSTAINDAINDARQQHLSRYATAIKRTTLKALGLCKKYKVYDDIETYEYVAQRKVIVLNGRDLYFLG